MGPDTGHIKGQTPIDYDERQYLKIRSISTRGELDEFEQSNIEEAVAWSLKHRFAAHRILTLDFIRLVHRRMFSEVWEWAGKFRLTNKNIGVDKNDIASHLKMMTDDCLYWIGNKSYPEDEIAIRFKHGLVKIHPFPNGNGRHSRLCADILISHALNKRVFTWGAMTTVQRTDSRINYLEAIYQADQGNYVPLLEFARS